MSTRSMELQLTPTPAPPPGAGPEEVLARILDRLEWLTARVERLEPLLEQAPAALAVVTDAVDEAVGRAAERGVDVDARLRDLLRLAGTLTAPEVVRALTALAARADRVEALLALADQAPGAVAMLVDSFDEAADQARGQGLDLDVAIRRGAGAALRFGSAMGPEQLDGLEALLRSGVLDPAAVRAVAALGKALAAGATDSGEAPGIIGLWRATRDPDVRRALGFAVAVGRAFGRELPAGSPAGRS